jgi:hypothetical protein
MPVKLVLNGYSLLPDRVEPIGYYRQRIRIVKWPASKTLGIPPISPKLSLLYLYLAHPAVNVIVSLGKTQANSV